MSKASMRPKKLPRQRVEANFIRWPRGQQEDFNVKTTTVHQREVTDTGAFKTAKGTIEMWQTQGNFKVPLCTIEICQTQNDLKLP